MKNQYFADITDYKKYSLLRFLNDRISGNILTAWLLTPDDLSNDGKHTHFLTKPNEFEKFEPDIFQSFKRHQATGRRSVTIVDEEEYIPGMTCFEDIIPDSENGRLSYMNKLQEMSKAHELIFFDPDNGMEVKSISYGRPRSSKYLYWQELRNFYQRDLSVLVYQHFGRVKREPFMHAHASRMIEETGSSTVLSIETSWAGFFLALQERHAPLIKATWHELQSKWGEENMRTRIHEV